MSYTFPMSRTVSGPLACWPHWKGEGRAADRLDRCVCVCPQLNGARPLDEGWHKR